MQNKNRRRGGGRRAAIMEAKSITVKISADTGQFLEQSERVLEKMRELRSEIEKLNGCEIKVNIGGRDILFE